MASGERDSFPTVGRAIRQAQQRATACQPAAQAMLLVVIATGASWSRLEVRCTTEQLAVTAGLLADPDTASPSTMRSARRRVANRLRELTDAGCLEYRPGRFTGQASTVRLLNPGERAPEGPAVERASDGPAVDARAGLSATKSGPLSSATAGPSGARERAPQRPPYRGEPSSTTRRAPREDKRSGAGGAPSAEATGRTGPERVLETAYAIRNVTSTQGIDDRWSVMVARFAIEEMGVTDDEIVQTHRHLQAHREDWDTMDPGREWTAGDWFGSLFEVQRFRQSEYQLAEKTHGRTLRLLLGPDATSDDIDQLIADFELDNLGLDLEKI